MGVTPEAHRGAARQFASGVTVVAAGDGTTTHAITATAFCSLSLEPPLVLLAVRTRSRLLDLVRRSGSFGVSVLADHQRAVGEWAATTGRAPQPGFPRHATVTAVTGAPLVGGALAWFDCRLRSIDEHGDHMVLVGLVEAVHADGVSSPLLYFRGGYHRLGEAVRRLAGEAEEVAVDEDETGL